MTGCLVRCVFVHVCFRHPGHVPFDRLCSLDADVYKRQGMHMNIGFIGAGKVGVSLGKYLTERGMTVTGYYSKSRSSASMAAEFTDTLSLIHIS